MIPAIPRGRVCLNARILNRRAIPHASLQHGDAIQPARLFALTRRLAHCCAVLGGQAVVVDVAQRLAGVVHAEVLLLQLLIPLVP